MLRSAGGITPGQIPGTATNDSAAAGNVGQFITSTQATPGTGLSNNTSANVSSVVVALTAGDWDVSGQVDFLMTGATVTQMQCGASLSSNTLPTQPGGSGLGTDSLVVKQANFVTVTGIHSVPIAPVRCSFSAASTNVVLVAQASFAAGTVSVYGTLRARRVR